MKLSRLLFCTTLAALTALPAIGHALARRCDQVRMASTYRIDQIRPHGSHPLINDLCSSAAVRVVHDGALP